MKTTPFIKYICLLIFLCSALRSSATKLYWVGGSGSWSDFTNHWSTTSGGAPNAAAAPTVFDSVYFDANSFTIPGQNVTNVNSATAARVDFTGITFSPSITGSNLIIAGSLILAPGINWDPVLGIGLATSTFLQTEILYTAGVVLGDIEILNLNVGEYVLGDALNSSGELRIKSGKFNTASYPVSCESISILPSSNLEIDLHESLITTAHWNVDVLAFQTFTMDADSASIFIDDPVSPGVFSTSGGGDIQYGAVWTFINTAFTGDSVRIRNLQIVSHAQINNGHYIIDTLILNNGGFITELNAIIYLKGQMYSSTTAGSPAELSSPSNGYIYKDAGNVCVDYLHIQNIVTLGAAHFYAGTGSTDLGGNTGWTFAACSSALPGYYWVGNSGNWNDLAHWATSSGGSIFHTALPGANDDIYIDVNSFTIPGQTITIDSNNTTPTRNIYFYPGISFTMQRTASNQELRVEGSIDINGNVLWDPDFQITCGFSYSSIRTGGSILPDNVFIGRGELLDDITVNGALTLVNISINAPIFYSNDHTITCKSYSITGSAELGNSSIYCNSASISVLNPPFDVSNLQNATFILTGPDSISFSAGYPQEIGTIIVDDYGSITQTGNVKNLVINDSVYLNSSFSADTVLLNKPGALLDIAGQVLTINDIITSDGASTDHVTITSSGLAILSKASGSLCLRNADLHNITTSGGAQFYADSATCNNNGGNTGWQFVPCSLPGYYWVGNSGNWDDLSHWATASGGSTFHTSLPDANDDIYIDGNSFTVPGQTITINSNTTSRNIYFHPDTAFTMQRSGPHWFRVEGSIDLNSNVYWNPDFQIDAGFNYASISTGGSMLPDHVNIGQGELLDDITVNGTFFVGDGFNSNDNVITCKSYSSIGSVELGKSTVYCSDVSVMATNPPLDLSHLEEATFISNGIDTAVIASNYPQQFGTFIINGPSNFGLNAKAHKLVINNNMYFLGASAIDTVLLNSPGDSLVFVTGGILTINNLITTNGTSSDHVTITTDGGLATINKTSGDVCLHFTDLQNITAAGGAQFYLDPATSINNGGNTGWQFVTCTTVTDVWPGDANYDGVVNNVDVLNIGLAFAEMGPVRSGASLAYVAQPAIDWLSNFTTAVNKKHADTDGDGLVTTNDTTAISLNYGLTHPLRLSSSSGGDLLYIDVAEDSASLGDTLILEFYLGTAADPVDSVYGLAFSLNFNSLLVDTTYATFDYSGSWLGVAGTDLLTFQKPLLSAGRIDFALTRMDYTNVSGSGWIGSCGIVIVDNIGAKMSAPFTLSNALSVTASENYLSLATADDVLLVDTATTGIAEKVASNIYLYPNPVKDHFRISCIEEIKSLEILDLSGKTISTLLVNQMNPTIAVHMKTGFYIARITTMNGTLCKKLQIISTENN